MDLKMDFPDILASTLHDTKNSLGMLFNTLEEIIEYCTARDCSSSVGFYSLQYEIKRLNHSLIRLLSLYKAEKSQFMINLDFHSVGECIEDIVLQNKPLLASKGIEIETECSEGMFWTFDRSLICSVLENVLNNAFRYAKDKVKISAGKENGYLMLKLEDNGSGYPEFMLVADRKASTGKKTIDFETGSTGLGLYFAMLVAQSHVKKEIAGHITIANGGAYGGGVFKIYIP
jgi:K+-sensing histidine kinase KdpD